jgi:hypothetical protein
MSVVFTDKEPNLDLSQAYIRVLHRIFRECQVVRYTRRPRIDLEGPKKLISTLNTSL